jgi:hypothetical protein
MACMEPDWLSTNCVLRSAFASLCTNKEHNIAFIKLIVMPKRLEDSSTHNFYKAYISKRLEDSSTHSFYKAYTQEIGRFFYTQLL